jgi:hypothetical protein
MKFKIRTYHPETKVTLSSHEALSFFHWLTSELAEMGGTLALFFSGFMMSIKAFFHTKSKIQRMHMESGRIIDLSRGRKRIKIDSS